MTMTLISAAELAERLGGADLRVFDVRHDLMNHAAGRQAMRPAISPAPATSITRPSWPPPHGQNGRHPLPSRAEFGALMAAHGVTPQTLVVAYDASGGMYAAHLWWMLRWLGHERVAVLDGGWQAWTAAGLPVSTEPGVAARPGQPVEPGASLAATVDAATVLAHRPARLYRDRRAPPPLSRRGRTHGPGGRPHPGRAEPPQRREPGTDGRFKAPEQLRAEFTALLAGRDPAAIVHQCGSGITACHNLLSMEIAGLSGSRLYPGSWSEWCSDPSRPVATGAVA